MKALTHWIRTSSPEKLLLIWLGILTVYRILSLTQGHMGLYYDEAYYFHWAQDLDWGYYSKPPMVAWIIALSTSIFGVSDVTAKLLSPVLYSCTAWLVFLISKQLSNNKQLPLIAAMVFSSTLLVGFNSMFITTDAGLYFFWSLTSYMFIRAIKTDDIKVWAGLGACLGLGMLCKYTFAALPLGLMLYLVVTRQFAFFISPKAWMAAVIGLLIASTNLYWNWNHDFISFTHTKEIAQLDGPLVKPGALAEFLLSQVFIFGIVWVIAFATKAKTFANEFTSKNNVILLVCILAPILTVISTQALLSRAFANWAGPFSITASILAAAALVQLNKRWLITGLSLHIVLLSLFYHWPPVLATFNVEQSKKNSPYFRLSGWRELTQQLEPVLAQNADAKYLSPSRNLLAYIGFYSHKHVADLVYWNPNRERVDNHYDLKNNIADVDKEGKQTYILFLKRPIEPEMSEQFKSTELLGTYKYDVSQSIFRKVLVYKVDGFEGYAQSH